MSISNQEVKKIKIDQLLVDGRHECRSSSSDLRSLELDIKAAMDEAVDLKYFEALVEGYQVLALIHMGHDYDEMVLDALEMSEAFIHKYNLPESAYLELYNTYVFYYQDYIGDRDMALKMCNKGICLAQKLDDKAMLMQLKAHLGTLVIMDHDYDQGENLLTKCLSYYEAVGDPLRSLYCRSNLGLALLGLGRVEDAKICYTEAMSQALGLQEDRIVQEAAIGLGKVYRARDKDQEAIGILIETIEGLKEKEHQKLAGKVILELSQLYLSTGNKLLSEAYMSDYEAYYRPNGSQQEVLQYHLINSELKEAFGDFRSAFYHSKEALNLERTIIAKKTKKDRNHRVISQVRQTVDKLETISTIGHKLVGIKDDRQLLSTLADDLQSLMPVDGIGLAILVDGDLRYSYYQNQTKDYSQFTAPQSEEGLGTWCLNHKKEMMLGDIGSEYKLYAKDIRRKVDSRIARLTQSVIYVPLMIKDQVIGYFNVQSYDTMVYDMEDLETIKVIAPYIGPSIVYRQYTPTIRKIDKAAGL